MNQFTVLILFAILIKHTIQQQQANYSQFNEYNNNFQSLFDLVNPSEFLHNYENWFSNKETSKSEETTTTMTTTSMTTQTNIFTQNYENYTTLFEDFPTQPPLLVGQTHTIKSPQSLTIFMNFKNDGTTSLQILSENNLNWFDLGNCRHGQIFHAATQLCVDLFCIEGYILTSQGKRFIKRLNT